MNDIQQQESNPMQPNKNKNNNNNKEKEMSHPPLPPNNHGEGDDDDEQTSHEFLSYWSLLGKVVSLFSLPLILFTITFALRLNNSISWSYWYVFIPVFLLLMVSLLLSTSERLSRPAPIQMRIAWLLCIICISTFVVFLILKLEGTTLGPWKFFYLPLYIVGGITFVAGFHIIFIVGCCGSEKNNKKYILSGTPVFCFGMVFLPLVIMLSIKEGVGDIRVTMDWAIVFIPLFVADGFCFCMGFFLLLFSFGGGKDALFSIAQLIIFLFVIPISVVFKILLILYMDNILQFQIVYCFIPLIVLELLLLFCGILAATDSNSKISDDNKKGYSKIPQNPEKNGVP